MFERISGSWLYSVLYTEEVFPGVHTRTTWITSRYSEYADFEGVLNSDTSIKAIPGIPGDPV
jgi:hypothetical protein